jgi:hypothetical protein
MYFTPFAFLLQHSVIHVAVNGLCLVPYYIYHFLIGVSIKWKTICIKIKIIVLQ